ncbi:hypothetical protein GJ496_008912 [Pomphorhynchus laevis]|nr:hypothetical protein GJ496_008912 [Pomphorhynchus laevis]
MDHFDISKKEINNDDLSKSIDNLSVIDQFYVGNERYVLNAVEYDDNVVSYDKADNSDVANEINDTCSIVVTNLPDSLFTPSNKLKAEFERIFSFDHSIKANFFYFSGFRRCRVDYTNPKDAFRSRNTFPLIELVENKQSQTYLIKPISRESVTLSMNNYTSIDGHLVPPDPGRLFLISPPSSPPVGWEQSIEDSPVINQELIDAIAKLDSSKSNICQLLAKTDSTPSIVRFQERVLAQCKDGVDNAYYSSLLIYKLQKLAKLHKYPSLDQQKIMMYYNNRRLYNRHRKVNSRNKLSESLRYDALCLPEPGNRRTSELALTIVASPGITLTHAGQKLELVDALSQQYTEYMVLPRMIRRNKTDALRRLEKPCLIKILIREGYSRRVVDKQVKAVVRLDWKRLLEPTFKHENGL